LHPILDCDQASAIGSVLGPKKLVKVGKWPDWPSREVSGKVTTPFQSHHYAEPVRVDAIPIPDGLQIRLQTEDPDGVRAAVATYLGSTENRILIENQVVESTLRGKEMASHYWAILAAIAATRMKRPVQLELSHAEDTLCAGGKRPISAQFDVAFDDQGTINGLRCSLLIDVGAYDLNHQEILTNTLLHLDNAYQIKNVELEAQLCRTNHAPRNPMIGDGSAEAILIMEEVISHVASAVDLAPEVVRERNLYPKGAKSFYRQKVNGGSISASWNTLRQAVGLSAVRQKTMEWNERHPHQKRGIAAIPVKLGVRGPRSKGTSASVLLNICEDQSVQLHVPGGRSDFTLLARVRQSVIEHLGVSPGSISLHPASLAGLTNPVAAVPSNEMGLSIKATVDACKKVVAAKKSGQAPLTAIGIAAPPPQDWNETEFVGSPFHRFVAAAAFAEVEVDLLTESLVIRKLCFVQDVMGRNCRSLDEAILDSGLRLGLGWLGREAANDGYSQTIGELPADFRLIAVNEDQGPEQYLHGGNLAQCGIALAVAVHAAAQQARS
ncbi:MAG: molybdopterin cofactor-binding domain-containing protein, partial [Verrucomicrobiota bacterium]